MKKTLLIFMSFVLCLQALFLVNVSAVESDFDLRKVSNPDRVTEDSIDGLVPGGDRGNSYAWSMAETDKYIWIGGNRNVLSGSIMQILGTMDLTVQQQSDIIKVVGQEKIPYETDVVSNNRPVVIRYNKETKTIENFYESPDIYNGTGEDSGFRVAKSFKGSVYFGTVVGGLGTNRVLRFDDSMQPGDQPETVYSLPMGAEITCIRAMAIHNDELYIGVVSGPNQVEILKSSDPEIGNWENVANTASFDNLVATGNNSLGGGGGGIWDLVSYNGYLYASIITSQIPTPGTNETYSGWGLYKGKPDDSGAWNWEPIVSSAEGAKYPLGMGIDIHTLATPYEFDGKLYIGTFNEPVHAMLQIMQYGSVDAVYESLSKTTHLYTLDENDDAELIVGDANDLFPNGSKSGLHAGYLDEQRKNTTLYTWRMEEHKGQLYLGTFDAYSLYRIIAGLEMNTLLNARENGLNLTQRSANEENATERLQNLEETWATTMEEVEANVAEIEKAKAAEQAVEPQPENKEAVLPPVEENASEDVSEGQETPVNNTDEVASEEPKVEEDANVAPEATVEETPVPVEPKTVVKEENNTPDTKGLFDSIIDVDQLIRDLNEILTLIPTEENIIKVRELIAATYDTLNKILEYNPLLPQCVVDKINELKSVLELIDNLLNNFDFDKYFEICRILTAEQDRGNVGADLFVLRDGGATMNAVTLNGFGSQYNYGFRTLLSSGDELFVGTANPFYGGQLWSVDDGVRDAVETTPAIKPSKPNPDPAPKPDPKPDPKPKPKPVKPEPIIKETGATNTGDLAKIFMYTDILLLAAGAIIISKRNGSTIEYSKFGNCNAQNNDCSFSLKVIIHKPVTKRKNRDSIAVLQNEEDEQAFISFFKRGL